ncbi:hypothetical protein GOBAR_DD23606 [Gossypium barbadense]|nr:hypothetical protein GOBAR_DD23606 [Gossypium barbadense]
MKTGQLGKDGFHAVCDSQDREANVDASSRHLETNSEVKGMPNGDSIISDGSATQSLMQRCQGTFNVMLENENEAGREIHGIEAKGLDNDEGVIKEQCIGDIIKEAEEAWALGKRLGFSAVRVEEEAETGTSI